MVRRATGWLIYELVQGYLSGAPRPCSRWLEKRLVRLSLILAFVFSASITDLFGAGPISDRYSYRFFSLLAAPFHPPDARDDVALVLIDDDDLENQDWLWPISYENHGRILDEIAKYNPRSVFIDFLFIDERDDPTFPALVAALQDLREHKDGTVRVFLPALPFEPPRGELEELSEPVSTELSLEAFSEDGYLLFSDTEVSPAYALFQAECGTADQPCEPESTFSSPMQIEWGLIPSTKNEFLSDCRYASKTDTWTSFRDVAKRLFFAGPTAAEAKCPFVPYIPVTFLLHDGFPEDRAALIEQELMKRIRGRDVIYSQSLAAVSAFVDPPTIGPISSGYRHAMALENLRLRGPDYLKSSAEIDLPFTLFGSDKVEITPGNISTGVIVLFALIHSFTSFATEQFLSRPDRSVLRHVTVDLAANGFYLVLVVAVVFVQVVYLRLAPLNYLGLYGLIAVVRGATGSFYLTRLERFLLKAFSVPAILSKSSRTSGEST